MARRNLYIDPTTYDLTVNGTYNLRITADAGEYLSAKLEARLKWFFAEWFLDREGGVPYFESILGKVDLNAVNSIFLAQIISIPEVGEVISFSTDYDGTTRTYTVSFEVKTSEGVTITGITEVGA